MAAAAVPATAAATTTATEQPPQGQDKEEDMAKRRLGRVEAAGILDELIGKLRVQQVRLPDVDDAPIMHCLEIK